MTGIHFVVDDKGNKMAVLIDLKQHGQLWEDSFDLAVARSRGGEPRESLEVVHRRIRAPKPPAPH